MNIQSIAIKNIDFSINSFTKFAVDDPSPTDFFPHPLPCFQIINNRLVPITGHGRLLDARDIGLDRIDGFIMENVRPAETFTLCLKDIAWSRKLNDADRATAIGKLDLLAPRSLPDKQLADVIGIEPSPGTFEQYKKIYRLGNEAVGAIRAGRLSFGCALAIADAPIRERTAFFHIFSEVIHPNRNMARRITENAVAVALTRNASVRDVLEQEAIGTILNGNISGPEKIRALDRVLYELRYPELSQQVKSAEELIRKAGFNSSVKVNLPAYLEGGRIEFCFKAKSPGELAILTRSILDAVDGESLDDLFELVCR